MKGQGEIVLYVDLDGVVHHEAVYAVRRGMYIDQNIAPGRMLFEWVHILIWLLAPYPEVKLVLSPSWCRRPGYSRTLRQLPAELQARFIGGTYQRRGHGADPSADYAFTSSPRGVQVTSDALRRQPRAWCAIDDDDLDWPASTRGNLIRCNGVIGLSSAATQRELQDWLDAVTGSPAPLPLPDPTRWPRNPQRPMRHFDEISLEIPAELRAAAIKLWLAGK